MTTYYVSKAGSDGANGLSTGAPFLTLAHALSVMGGGDTLNLRQGDTWTEQLSVPPSKSGTFAAHTVFDSYAGSGGNAKAKVVSPTPTTTPACLLQPGLQYVDFNDLEISQGVTPTGGTPIAGHSAVETTPGTGSVTFIQWNRCYIHDSGNCGVQAFNGPCPRSSFGNGTGSGDDSDWTFTDCEIYRAASSCVASYGSRWTFLRTHIHRWGESSDVLATGKHGVLDFSIYSIFDACIFHNDEAGTPQGGQAVAHRVTGTMIRDCTFHDCVQGVVAWHDNVAGTTLYLRNRMWNMYTAAFVFAAATDATYVWTPAGTPVDKFVFANNVHHSQQGGPMFTLTDASAVYAGGLVIANNVIIGSYTNAISMSPFQSNGGVIGQLIETRNIWIAYGLASPGQFTLAGVAKTLAQWQTTTVNGLLQGNGSFYTSNPGLGLAPPGDARRAPTPYMVLGVVQTQNDNALINTYGAPDFCPQTG